MPGSVAQPGPGRLVDRHPYRDEIIELLAADRAPWVLSAMLGRLRPNRVSVRTLLGARAKDAFLR